MSPAAPPEAPLPAARVLVVLTEDRAGEAGALAAPLGDRGGAEILPGADALFRAGLPALGRAVVAFVASRG